MHGSISYLHWDAVFIPFLIILAFLGDRDDDTSHTPLKQEVFTDQTLILTQPFRRVEGIWKQISKMYACRKCIIAGVIVGPLERATGSDSVAGLRIWTLLLQPTA